MHTIMRKPVPKDTHSSIRAVQLKFLQDISASKVYSRAIMRKAKKATGVFTKLLESTTVREAFTIIFDSEPAPTRGSKRMSAIFQTEYQTMLEGLPAPKAITSRTTRRHVSQRSTGSRSGQYQRGPRRVNMSSIDEEGITQAQGEVGRDKPLPPLPAETLQSTFYPGPREPICGRYASQAHETLAELRSGMSVTPEKQESREKIRSEPRHDVRHVSLAQNSRKRP